jgi:oligopeptide transport system substrate-binding protein
MEADSWQRAARVRLMIGVMASVALIAGVAFAAHTPTANRKIVVFREGTTRQLHRQVVERHGHKVLQHLDLLNAVAIGFDDHAGMDSAALESDPRVAGVYEDHQISADHMVAISPVAAPPVELFPWGLGHIGVPGVFELIASEAVSAPMVAILDTGIDPSHPEPLPHLAGGYNARAGEDPSNYQDHNGHGTHMAGIIAAELNGSGIIGTATDPKLVAVKVLDDTGHGYVSDLVYALQWVLKNSIRVVSMSLSFSEVGQAPVGTGPFTFVRWEPNQDLVLEANAHYYEGRPFLDAAIYTLGGKFEEEFAEFLDGHLEEAIVPSDRTDEVATDPKYRAYQVLRKPTLSLLYVGFNTQVKPYDDKRVRQAFNYAVNREAIVQTITRMSSVIATGALPPGMAGHDPDVAGYPYDPAKAKRLLAEAGYPDGSGFPTVQLWSVSKAESTKAELAAYQRYLSDLGLKVEVHFAPDWPVYRDMLERGALPMFRLAWYADIPDPHNFLWPVLHSRSPTNRTFYRNPKVDQLLNDGSKESDEAQRVMLYREVERIVLKDAPWIAQHYHVLERIYQPHVRGVEVSLLGDRAIPMKKIWLMKSHATRPTEATSGAQSPR